MDTGFLDHKSSPLEFLKNKKKLKKERKRKKNTLGGKSNKRMKLLKCCWMRLCTFIGLEEWITF